MPYCTKQNMIDRTSELEIVQLTNRDDPTAITINDAVLNNAITSAGARINRYITSYLPLTNIPEDFKQIACDITLYFLYYPLVPEHIQAVYDDAIKYLEKVASGKIPIAPDAGGTVDEPAEAMVSFSSGDSVFSRGSY
jgi:phage gp36-like protein